VSDTVATIDAEPEPMTWIFSCQKESNTKKLVSIITMKLLKHPNVARLYEHVHNNTLDNDMEQEQVVVNTWSYDYEKLKSEAKKCLAQI
nr:hypothetical protein [Tanacetum cinerariifolium]